MRRCSASASSMQALLLLLLLQLGSLPLLLLLRLLGSLWAPPFFPVSGGQGRQARGFKAGRGDQSRQTGRLAVAGG